VTDAGEEATERESDTAKMHNSSEKQQKKEHQQKSRQS
jgi:hypothetical protein